MAVRKKKRFGNTKQNKKEPKQHGNCVPMNSRPHLSFPLLLGRKCSYGNKKRWYGLMIAWALLFLSPKTSPHVVSNVLYYTHYAISTHAVVGHQRVSHIHVQKGFWVKSKADGKSLASACKRYMYDLCAIELSSGFSFVPPRPVGFACHAIAATCE